MRISRFWLILYVIVSALFISHAAFSQTTISGNITEESTGESLAGVNIIVKGRVIGTITDTRGNFELVVNENPPITLLISFIGFETQEIEITQPTTTNLQIAMKEQILVGQEVVVSASRVEENILESPVSIEKMDIRAIRDAASPSFYDALANLKGIDVSTQSITNKSINPRGFTLNGNTRFVQLIDGIDNQAPGLNFSVGNVVGISELDLESIELLPGAASALYGPNALNGILLMNSKSPFEYQGLSAYAKVGVNHVDGDDDDPSLYQDYGIRYAKAFKNRFAFKITASYLRAADFIGVDYRDQSDLLERGEEERGNNRVYNGLNIYGDPLLNLGEIGASTPVLAPVRTLLPFGETGNFTPTGYSERSFVDNTTESMKLGGALHYRINDNIEALVQYNYGFGSSVYTGNDRYVLDDFTIWTGKAELRGSRFFLRGYTTQEDAGDTYAANALASRINASEYVPVYVQSFVGARAQGLGIEDSHAFARQRADGAQNDNFLPGSPLFGQLFDSLRQIAISEGGAKLIDKTALWHVEGMYNFSDFIPFAEVIAGGNYRRYSLNSSGTLFALQDDGEEFDINEWGAYVQLSKWLLNDKLHLTASVRYDKNENFDGQFSPRVSGVYTIAGTHNIRASYQRGFRIPTTQDQYIDLDIVTRRLVGSVPVLVDRYRFRTNTVYSTPTVNAARDSLAANGNMQAAIDLLEPVNFEEFKPETINTFEVGYKSLIDNKLYIDAYYYFSAYQNFISEIGFTQAVPNGITNPGPDDPNADATKQAIIERTIPTQDYEFVVNTDGNIKTHGWAIGMEYSLPQGYKLGGNVAYNELIDQDDLIRQGFRANYNTPKWRYVINLSNQRIAENTGFNLVWRWQDAFLWESTIGAGIIPAYGTLDAQVSYKVPRIKSIFKIGGSNILNNRYTTSIANPRIGAIYYVSITFDEFLN